VQDVAVLPEHVDLLHACDRLHVQLLERALELLVVLRVCGLRFAHDLSPHGALPACTDTDALASAARTNDYHALNGKVDFGFFFFFFFFSGAKGHVYPPFFFGAGWVLSLASFFGSRVSRRRSSSNFEHLLAKRLSVGHDKENKVCYSPNIGK